MNTIVARISAAVDLTVSVREVPQGRYWTTRHGQGDRPFCGCEITVAIRDASVEELSYIFERFCFIAWEESDYCYATGEIEPVLYLGVSHQMWHNLFQLAGICQLADDESRTVSELVVQLKAAQEARNAAEDLDREEENARQHRFFAMLDAQGVSKPEEVEVFEVLAGYSPGGAIRIGRRMVVQDQPLWGRGERFWRNNSVKTAWLRAYAAKHGGLEAAKAAAKAAMEGCAMIEERLAAEQTGA